ncbi:MAG: winged helix-turn-helix domain-containing protein [Candidatus Nanoarchaeia archaeon]
MGYVVIAPVGDQLNALFKGIKEFHTERVVLICPEGKLKQAQKIVNDLKKFDIPVQIYKIKGNIWEEMFAAVAEITAQEKGKNLIVNVGTGDSMGRCAATSAAFVNGLKAFDVTKDGPMLLPILKFSYYKILSEKKMKLLEILSADDCCASLEELSKRTNMSLPLVSYHVNGNLRSEGLKDLGLVQTTEDKGRVAIALTSLGRLLLKGYIKPPKEE